MIRQLILTIAICFGIAYGQTFSAIFHNDFPPNYMPIGTTSRTYGVSLTQNPTSDSPVVVNLASDGLQFSPSSFTFTSTSAVVQSFTATATALGYHQVNVTGGVAEQNFYVSITQRVIYAQEQSTSHSVGQWTNFVSFATTYDDPSSDLAIHVNLTSSDTSRISLSSVDTQLSNSNRGGYLTLRSDVEGSSVLRFTPTGTRADWYQISTTATPFSVYQRNIIVPTNLNAFKVGQRVPFQILLSKPSSGSLSITPAGSGLFFEPSTVNFGSGSLSSTVTVYAKYASDSPVQITYTVSGSDAVMYDSNGITTIARIDSPVVTCLPATYSTSYKQPFHINCNADSFTDSVTITPSGEGMSFSPQSITFSAGCTAATFEVTPAVVGSIPIYYDISGSNFYATFSPSSQIHTINVNKRIIGISGPSANVAGGENYLTVSLYGSDNTALYPPYSSLTVTPCTQSNNLVSFEPDHLTFDNTQSTGAISVRPLVPGVTKVDFSFTLSGDDAYGFQIVPSYSNQIVNNVFEVKYYTDDEHVKQYQRLPALNTTEAFNVSVYNIVGNVTLTPESAVVTFTPSSYTFTRTDTTAHFNVTGMRSGTSYVTFKLSGDSARLFTVPKPTLQITVLGSSAAVTLASTLLILLCAFIVL